ncbi:DUF262 domain-containing protein [Micrococcus aloeverae]|uniref:DUF262 domain-containing protein n=1 Tax=Micrococcus aloeverae TaxID=1391911 RepID=UPI00106CD500|nr:DUF262 domain-containing protein [Micrococcus aloeverae]TFE79750.1 DUF262 domain-containing protein [Micrococcus aloeverae]
MSEYVFDPPVGTNAEGMTVNSFYKRAVSEPPSLVLRAAFQRNMVWRDDQRAFLVDSILRGLPVPEVYIQSFTSAEGDEQLIVVDGQQRISACIDFIDDRFVLESRDEEDIHPDWRGKRFSELPDSLKEKFRSFRFVARTLQKQDEGVLREIFRRLNKTVEALEPQELRHAAFSGELIQLVETAGASEALRSIGLFSPKDYLRRRNDEFVAEILFSLDSRSFPNKKEGLDKFFAVKEKLGMRPEDRADLVRRLGRAFSFLGTYSTEFRRSRFKNKSDAYTLIIYLANRAEVIPEPGGAAAENFKRKIIEFGDLVSDARSTPDNYQRIAGFASSDSEVLAHTYMTAVSNAASDRLNRVKRDAALEEYLAPYLETRERPLGPVDENWCDEVEEVSRESDEQIGGSIEEERADLIRQIAD